MRIYLATRLITIIFLPFLIILLFVTPVNASSRDWVEFGRDPYGNIFSYNKIRITHTTKDIVQVWGKKDFSNEGRGEYVRLMKKRGMSLGGYGKISITKSLKEIDCKKLRFQTLYIKDCDTDGEVLFSHSYDETDWNYIRPNTIMDGLREKVCKKQ